MKAILIILIILVSSICWGDVYQWVDEKGTVHFAEDPATIPEKYRQKAKSRTMEENSMPTQKRIRSEQGREGTAEQKIMIPPKNRYTKDEFERLIIGKTREEIINTFGNPSSIQSSSSRRSNEYWYYKGGIVRDPVTKTVFLVYDPITEKVFDYIQIIFEYRTVPVGALSTREDYFAVRINY
jgi:hypothetical protein